MLAAVLAFACTLTASAGDDDRKDVRSGNRKFAKEEYREAAVDYQKALLRDSTSFAATYNLANALYRMQNWQEAASVLDSIASRAPESEYAADYFYNRGNTALSLKDYGKAVEVYREALLRNPGDLDAKENYIYAKKMLENRQNSQNQDNQDNQNRNNQDQNQNQDQNGNDRNNNEGDNDDNQDRNGNGRDNDRPQDGQSPQSAPQISKQAAQQMLNAIMAKEKETQDKVKKEKAAVLQSRQKEKNW